jgi:hypothetical protein
MIGVPERQLQADGLVNVPALPAPRPRTMIIACQLSVAAALRPTLRVVTIGR